MKPRIEYYDFLRGIAIIMVVGIHTFIPYSLDTPIGWGSMILRNLLNCAVPVFLTLSGLLMGRKSLGSSLDRTSFWRKQIPKVYIPTLIWSIPYFVQYVYAGGGIIRGLIMLFTCSFSIYYFIALIIQYYLLLPFLQKNRNKLLLPSIIISFLTILVVTYLTKFLGIQLPLIILAGPFPVWIMFFMLGVYYAVCDVRFSVRQALVLLIIGLVLSITETYFLNINYGGGFGIKPSSFIYSLGVIMFLLTPMIKEGYKNNKFNSAISYVGGLSFGIYLIHYFVIDIVDRLLPFNSWSVSWIIVLIISSLVVIVVRAVFPRNISKYLGF